MSITSSAFLLRESCIDGCMRQGDTEPRQCMQSLRVCAGYLKRDKETPASLNIEGDNLLKLPAFLHNRQSNCIKYSSVGQEKADLSRGRRIGKTITRISLVGDFAAEHK